MPLPTLTPHTTRAAGSVLTSAIYNADHETHLDNVNLVLDYIASDLVSGTEAALLFQTLADASAASAFGVSAVLVNAYDVASVYWPTLYQRVSAQPTHAMWFQDILGNFYEIDKTVIDVRSCGALGDGTTDDSNAIQRAFDVASKRYRLAGFRSPTTTYLISKPVVAPPGCIIQGDRGGKSAVGRTILKAAAVFTSTLTMLHWVGAGNVTYNVAALLVSQAFRDNGTFGNGLIDSVDVEGITFDGGSSYNSGTDTNTPKFDNRGAPIHGCILMGSPVRVEKCYFNNTSGFGCWITCMGANGLSVSSLVSPKLLRNRSYNNGGSMTNTYTTNGGTNFYSAIHVGLLIGVQEAGNTVPAGAITDGVLDNFEQADPCYGAALSITDGGSWSITKVHGNQPRAHGILIDSAFITRVSDNFIDGWGKDIPASYGAIGAIQVNTVTNAGTFTAINNDIRYATPNNLTGNFFCFFKIQGRLSTDGTSAQFTKNRFQITGGASASVPYLFDITLSGAVAITFKCQIEGNIDNNGFAEVFRNHFDETKADVQMADNTWQLFNAAPSDGKWYPSGYQIKKRGSVTGSPTGWRKLTTGTANDWAPEYNNSRILLASSAVAVSFTNDTALKAYANITIPAGLMGLNGTIDVLSGWSFTGSTNSKTMSHKLSSATGTGGSNYANVAVVSATALSFPLQVSKIKNRGAANSQVGPPASSNGAVGGSNTSILQTSAVNTAVDSFINITGQMAALAETQTLEFYEVWLTT
jgi:hypothetical protein